MTDLLNNQNHSGLTLNGYRGRTLALRTQTKLRSTNREKTSTLNEQPKSVFIHEPNISIPDKGQLAIPDTPGHNTSTAGLEKPHSYMNQTKACGPDELSPRLLITANNIPDKAWSLT